MPYLRWAALLLTLFNGGCSTIRETQPPRTATEQLLISAAADRAAGELRLPLAPHTKVYVDATNFGDNFDVKYALGAIRAGLLRQGLCLVSKEEADTVLEIRSGALSVNQTAQLWLGVPSFKFPVPFFGAVTIPEIPLLKNELQEGIAKFAVAAYGAKDGTLRKLIGPVYGISRVQKYVVLSVPWTKSDILPAGFDDQVMVK
jgi:hypothetical protein